MYIRDAYARAAAKSHYRAGEAYRADTEPRDKLFRFGREDGFPVGERSLPRETSCTTSVRIDRSVERSGVVFVFVVLNSRADYVNRLSLLPTRGDDVRSRVDIAP